MTIARASGATPKGKWGKGWVELVQIPTDDEIHDNIVAFWRPAAAPVGQPLSFAYTLKLALSGSVPARPRDALSQQGPKRRSSRA